MIDYHKPPRRPAWVTVGLAGLPGCASALRFFWSRIACAAAAVVLGFYYPLAWFGVIFVFSAWWYWASIRWVDRNDHW